MIDVYLIVLAVVVPVLILMTGVYIVVYFQHPYDKNTFWTAKIVVLGGISLAMATVLMIPFDVANQGEQFGCGVFTDDCGGLIGIGLVWQLLFLGIALFIFVINPFTLFFTEAFDQDRHGTCQACMSAAWYQIFFTIIGAGLFVIAFVLLQTTELPVDNYDIAESNWHACSESGCSDIILGKDELETRVALPSSAGIQFGTPLLVFLPGFLGFVGWFLFSVYAGIGLVALPIELIRAFIYRPRLISRETYLMRKEAIGKQTVELIKLGNELRAKQAEAAARSRLGGVWSLREKQRETKMYNEFKQAVIDLEDEYEDIKLSYEKWLQNNPLIPWTKLLLGIIGVVLSLIWILHIVFYNLWREPYGPDGVPKLYLLNTLFNVASKQINFALLGTVLVGVFAYWLLFATMKGNERFGLRFLIIEIHPIKYKGTLMNAFLVNSSLLLFCIAPLIQFVSAALQEYLVLTDVDAIFGQQVRFLQFFSIFFENNVFVIVMLAVSFITAFLMIFCPNDSRMSRARKLAKRMEQYKRDAAKQPAARVGRTQPGAASASSSNYGEASATLDAMRAQQEAPPRPTTEMETI